MSRTKGGAARGGGTRRVARRRRTGRKEGSRKGKEEEEEEETEDNGEDDGEETRGRRIVSWWLEASSPPLSFSLSSFCFHDGKAGLHTEVNGEGPVEAGEWVEGELESRTEACAPRLLKNTTKRTTVCGPKVL